MTTYFNRFEVSLPKDCVRDCSRQGACDESVEFWEGKVKLSASPDDIRAELREYGAWDDEELADDKQNRHRLIWIAACNINEERACR